MAAVTVRRLPSREEAFAVKELLRGAGLVVDVEDARLVEGPFDEAERWLVVVVVHAGEVWEQGWCFFDLLGMAGVIADAEGR